MHPVLRVPVVGGHPNGTQLATEDDFGAAMTFIGEQVDPATGLAKSIRVDNPGRSVPAGQWLGSGSPTTSKIAILHRTTPTARFQTARVLGEGLHDLAAAPGTLWNTATGAGSHFGASIASLGRPVDSGGRPSGSGVWVVVGSPLVTGRGNLVFVKLHLTIDEGGHP